jgi:uncharacterized protein YybS (DUF2232 family)
MSTTALTEAAMLGAVMVVLSLLAFFLIPYLVVVIPLPLIILVVRHGLRTGIATTVVASIIIGMFDPMLVIVILFQIGVVGIALGEAIRESFSPPVTLILGIGAALVANLLLIAISFYVLDISLMEEFGTMLNESVAIMERLNTKLGLPVEQVDAFAEMMKKILPAVLLVGVGMTVTINYGLSIVVFRRLGMEIRACSPFKEWRMPRPLGVVIIITQVADLFVRYPEGHWSFTVMLNLRLVLMTIAFIYGLALLWFYLDKYRVPTIWRVIVIFLLFLNPLVYLLITWAAILDVWFDFRKKDQQSA